MSHPRRLLDQTNDLSDAERRALVAGRDVCPPSDFSSDVWAALAARLPPPGSFDPSGGAHGGPGGPVPGPTAAASGTGAVAAKVVAGTGLASMVKAAAVGAALGTAMLTGKAMLPSSTLADTTLVSKEVHAIAAPAPAPIERRGSDPSSERPEAPASSVALGEIVVPTPREVARNAEPAPRRSIATESGRVAIDEPTNERPAELLFADPAPAPVAPPSSSRVAEDARDESRLVATARDAVRSGDPVSAFASLERARQRYPNGILVQEREALFIEALVGSGRRAEAEARAGAFLRDYPGSAHAARVRAVIR